MKRIKMQATCILRTIFHPFEGFGEIKYRKTYSISLSCIILALWFFVSILSYQFTGFPFNGHKPDSINVLLIFAQTVGLFIVLTVINWALCTLMDGEGTLKEIWVACSYALVPYILVLLLNLTLSRFLVLEEQAFLTGLGILGNLWLIWQQLCALFVVHQYSFSKTIISAVLTIIGFIIVLFIALLFFSLLQQVGVFISTVFDEILLW